MNRKEIFNKVEEVFKDVLEEDFSEIKESYGAADVDGWDSLTHIMLIVETEKKFNIKFLSNEIVSWDNIGEMIDCIQQKFS
jgi:acyl carrier protein